MYLTGGRTQELTEYVHHEDKTNTRAPMLWGQIIFDHPRFSPKGIILFDTNRVKTGSHKDKTKLISVSVNPDLKCPPGHDEAFFKEMRRLELACLENVKAWYFLCKKVNKTRQDDPIFDGKRQKWHERVKKALGFYAGAKLRPHDLRHTRIDHWRRFLQIKNLMSFSGHYKAENALIYYHPTIEENIKSLYNQEV